MIVLSKHVDELIEKKITAIKNRKNIYELGRVSNVNDHIIEVEGLDNVGFYEKVTIEDKAEGYVNAIGQRYVTVAITKKNGDIYTGVLPLVRSLRTLFPRFNRSYRGHV